MQIDAAPLYSAIFRFYKDAQDYKSPATGRYVLPKIFAQGSSRSSKTYNFIKTIVTFCDANREKPIFVSVLRSTLDSAREYTFKDFLECFRDTIGLVEGEDFTQKSSPKPQIVLWGSTISFYGLMDSNTSGGGRKEAPRSDIVYVNEAIENGSFENIDNWIMRCEMLFLADFNPSKLSHVVYDYARRENTAYFNVSYLNNPYLSDMQVSDIESRCPWDFRDSVIEVDGWGLAHRRWKVEKESDRRPNLHNIANGTVDRFKWLVYGEGNPTAQEGTVYDATFVDKRPDIGYDDTAWGLDFGYSVDPSALVRVDRAGMRLCVEYKAYQVTPDPDTLYQLIRPVLKNYQLELMRELSEARVPDSFVTERPGSSVPDEDSPTDGDSGVPLITIVCESSDKYKDVEFVRDLNLLSSVYNDRFQFVKVKKPRIVARVAFLKKFNITVVRSIQTSKGDFESENEFASYVYERKDGILTNMPIDKYNHGINAMEYAAWYCYRWIAEENRVKND